eukprot:TRINITY_DN4782_c0_g1_i1.p1 TRINITY_DN4782_c0_g1~~TRINITY_DN4782_c0_g1_i1.p1  ORF type:complete len:213 (-),score=82.92 TRINITY_DN4782_c0_g1_i1:134-772(-)
MPNPKCVICAKTVYPMEAITAIGKTWHKPCFKCQGEGCGIRLTLKSYTGVGGKVYCKKCVPKDKPTSLTVNQSMSMSNAINAPKVDVVSNEKRGAEGVENPIGSTVEGDLHLSRAKEAHANSRKLVNNQRLAQEEDEKNCQAVDYSLNNAINAPKLATVNQQVKLNEEDSKNSQVADMSLNNAIKAPKLDTVNEQVKLSEEDSKHSNVGSIY